MQEVTMNHHTIKTNLQAIVSYLMSQDLPTQVEIQNYIKQQLHNVSPFKKEPVDCVIWVKQDTVEPNPYNPNSVALPEFQLLEVSILNDGYTQPVVTWEEKERREIIDGFHRSRIAQECKVIQDRIFGYMPVVTANQSQTGKNDRIASTIRHNRARGKHAVSAMVDIVIELKKRNWSEARISKELGMDEDEILRLCQISGLAEAFENEDFSAAWESAIHANTPLTDIDFESTEPTIDSNFETEPNTL